MVCWSRKMRPCSYVCHRRHEGYKYDLSSLALQWHRWLGRVRSSAFCFPWSSLQPQMNGNISAAVVFARAWSRVTRPKLIRLPFPGLRRIYNLLHIYRVTHSTPKISNFFFCFTIVEALF